MRKWDAILVAVVLALASAGALAGAESRDRVSPVNSPVFQPSREDGEQSSPGDRAVVPARERPAQPFGSPPLPHTRRIPPKLWA